MNSMSERTSKFSLRKICPNSLQSLLPLLLSLSMSISMQGIFAPQVMADGMVSSPYDWVVEMETKPLERQFQFQDSALKDIEKVQIVTYANGKEDEKKAYEYLWFNHGKAYGMEKQRKFDLPQGEGVCLRVKHKGATATSDERKAAANSILRLAIDTFLNKNPIVQVRLPNDSYNDIVNELIGHGFQQAPENSNDFDGGFSADLILNIYSEQDGMKTVLYR